jgi:golgi phosphoprotein 3
MRRRGAGGASGLASGDGEGSTTPSRANSSSNVRDSAPETGYENGENGHKIAYDPRDLSETAERSKQPKLTMMEEILLLGLKDKQVRTASDNQTILPPLLQCAEQAVSADAYSIRDTSRSGTTISPMPCEAASS